MICSIEIGDAPVHNSKGQWLKKVAAGRRINNLPPSEAGLSE
jgi:hypothetical protein